MIPGRARLAAASATAATLLLGLAACVPNTTAATATRVSVESSADACTVSAASAPSGTVVFEVSNPTNAVTEFYLLAGDGQRIVGEVENITPGVPRELTVQLPPGDYVTSCKPGMVGTGVGTAAFEVTDSGVEVEPSGTQQDQLDAAAANYIAYVKDQVAQLVAGSQTFLEAYLAGDTEKAKALYAITRAHYERIEPVAESFGDLDPKIDFREVDVEAGTEWTGWHRIEKDLWPPSPEHNNGKPYQPLTAEERTRFAGLLADDTRELYDAVHDEDYTVTADAISNGAIGLLDEVANGKITGEEEIWSHTDLWDFQANLEGARVAYEGVRDIVIVKDAALVRKIDTQFAALERQLAAYGSLDAGFRYYNDLDVSDIRDLADGVNALGEPLSRLTAALVD
ncbi:peptidase M75 family protein [soil metagenome]